MTWAVTPSFSFVRRTPRSPLRNAAATVRPGVARVRAGRTFRLACLALAAATGPLTLGLVKCLLDGRWVMACVYAAGLAELVALEPVLLALVGRHP